MHLNRTGDDTSGREWERTRKYGANALAFRMLHHEAFFLADADCIGIMGEIDWMENVTPEKWLLNGKETHFNWFEETGIKAF